MTFLTFTHAAPAAFVPMTAAHVSGQAARALTAGSNAGGNGLDALVPRCAP